MNKIGKMLMEESEMLWIRSIQQEIKILKNTQRWLNKQSLKRDDVEKSIVERLQEQDTAKKQWIKALRKKAKQQYPEGKKLVLKLTIGEAEIYG